jgi:phosphoglycolate phosphatase-like HAD superfamily hydrolase
MLHLCLERAGVIAKRAVYVGDSATDLIAAEAAGLHFIGLGERAPHVHQIERLEELSAKLQEIFGV